MFPLDFNDDKKNADMLNRYRDYILRGHISPEVAAILAVGERLSFELAQITKILHSRS